MKDICITICLNERYAKYIPMFAYFISQAYPTYGARIFMSGKAGGGILRCLDLIEGDYKLYENCFKDLPRCRISYKSYRWINYSEDFEDYKYVYVSDADMLICPEIPSLLEQHIVHCQILGCCYSNFVRSSSIKRLSGLHFLEVKPWFEKMLPIIKKYRKLLQSSKIKEISDEVMFYRMVKESGLPILKPRDKKIKKDKPTDYHFRPHHGLHLGVFRSASTSFTSQFWTDANLEHFKFFEQIKIADVGRKILEICPLLEIDNMQKSHQRIMQMRQENLR